MAITINKNDIDTIHLNKPATLTRADKEHYSYCFKLSPCQFLESFYNKKLIVQVSETIDKPLAGFETVLNTSVGCLPSEVYNKLKKLKSNHSRESYYHALLNSVADGFRA